jgi:hypothetical protein
VWEHHICVLWSFVSGLCGDSEGGHFLRGDISFRPVA